MISEKIQPIAKAGRKELIYRYCPPEIQQQILEDRKNQHCLVRPYLGHRRRDAQSNSRCRFVSLRNCSLHMDQVEELTLPFFEYTKLMAWALAFLNWELGIYGRRRVRSCRTGATATSGMGINPYRPACDVNSGFRLLQAPQRRR